MVESYFNNSIIESTLNITNFSKELHQSYDFLKFGRWLYIPKEWFTDPRNYPDFAFSEFGRGIARGEEKYIIDQILNCQEITIDNISQFTYDHLIRIAEMLGSKNFQSEMNIFLPIEYYKSLVMDWVVKNKKVQMKIDHFYADGFNFKLFWSNKFLEFDKIIITTKTFAQWIAKPSIKNRLEVKITESKDKTDQMELQAETKFHFRIENPDEIKVLSAPIPSRSN